MSKFGSYCNDGCRLGNSCGGSSRSEVILALCEYFHPMLILHFQGCTDDQLDELAGQCSDEDFSIGHIRRHSAQESQS